MVIWGAAARTETTAYNEWQWSVLSVSSIPLYLYLVELSRVPRIPLCLLFSAEIPDVHRVESGEPKASSHACVSNALPTEPLPPPPLLVVASSCCWEEHKLIFILLLHFKFLC